MEEKNAELVALRLVDVDDGVVKARHLVVTAAPHESIIMA